MSSFLSELKKKSSISLRSVPSESINDRSVVKIDEKSQETLENEEKHWKIFFQSGCGSWFESIKDLTFTSTFCELTEEEARIIVRHWDELRRLKHNLLLDTNEACSASNDLTTLEESKEVLKLLSSTIHQLKHLEEKLDIAIANECRLSPVGKVFVKLSTRSPKDSKKALKKASEVYKNRINSFYSTLPDPNTRWRILCEETTQSCAVNNSRDALELLLDSERVYEDLEFALRGPPVASTSTSIDSNSKDRKLLVDLVVRAWDPSLKPESEFRGICWNGKLTCLCQYFHPLYFEELVANKELILSDILNVFESSLSQAVESQGGYCIIDFAWLGPGKVIIIELNPFDGLCLGVFPASTGLFLWDDPTDKAIMMGDAPFEFRIRLEILSDHILKNQVNKEWKDIIYSKN